MATLTKGFVDSLAYYNWEPRPDCPERFDQQSAFMRSRHSGVTALLGGNGAGCCAAEQQIYDPVENRYRRIGDINSRFHVIAMNNQGIPVVAIADRPCVFGYEDLYDVRFSNGRSIRVTLGHRLLTPQGWREIGDILRESPSSSILFCDAHDLCQASSDVQQLSVFDDSKDRRFARQSTGRWSTISVSIGHELLSGLHVSAEQSQSLLTVFLANTLCQLSFLEDDLHCYRKPQDYLASCCCDCRQYDEQPQCSIDIDQFFVPSLNDVQTHIHACCDLDGKGFEQEYIHWKLNEMVSILDFCHPGNPCLASWPRTSSQCGKSLGLSENTQVRSLVSNMLAIDGTTRISRCLQCQSHYCTIAPSIDVAMVFPVLSIASSSLDHASSHIQLSVTRRQQIVDAASRSFRFEKSSKTAIPPSQESRRSEPQASLDCTSSRFRQSAICDHACYTPDKRHEQLTHITGVAFVRRDEFWDFHVPGYENYWMGGCWNHNTTTCGIAKAVDFMVNQQVAPRKDTPFWIISQTYEMSCNTCWKEKLHLQGHLHPNDIDWARIHWLRPNQDWPFKVPLKPKPGYPGRNWQICFKSYEQGRSAMQAESIGGFLFVEQFPWGLLEEVLRGCREYSFVGNKLIEFTPVDPSLCSELRDMEVSGKLPEGWGLYRCNTEVAMEHGHVSKQWFREFFGMVPPSMRKVRMTGHWGAFEGAVYPEWNPEIHVIRGEWNPPSGWYHRRGTDFGFSVDHPFVTLFGCYDSTGTWVIYDEYWNNDTSKTVIDHWLAVDKMHYWPLESPYYGTTYVDHDLDAIKTLNRISEYTQGECEVPAMQKAMKSIQAGIEHVKYLLKSNRPIVDEASLGMRGEDGQMMVRTKMVPRLFVVEDRCPKLCKQFITYRYPKRTNVGSNAIAPMDLPVKMDDDAMDALRYMLYSEAMNRGATPSTIASQHDAGSVQIKSDKFRKRRPRR